MKERLRWYEIVAGLVVGIAVISALAWFDSGSADADASESQRAPAELMPTFGGVAPGLQPWARGTWRKVVQACPGLTKYRSDLEPSSTDGYTVDEYGDDGRVVFGVIKVADKPKHAELYKHRAQGHNCYFGMEHSNGSGVLIAKAPCKALCLDKPFESGTGTDLRLELK